MCRFRIRELLRESIKISYPTYYDLKNRAKQKYEDDEDESVSEFSSRCATRLFLGHNTFTEAELRLLMHGRLNFHNNED